MSALRRLLVPLLAALPALCSAADDPADPAPRVTFERAPLGADLPAPRDAQGRPAEEVAGASLRWWARRGRSDVGFGIGSVGYVAAGDGLAVGPLLSPTPSLSIGWRYRLGGDTALYADATRSRLLAPDGSMPGIVNAKVGVEWKPASSRFGFEHRAIGFQLQSGYRMSLRARHGGLGVYLRGQF